ncbi:Branched-chain amino acid transport system / permease component [Anaerobutyricum hallii]|uniref:Branched-chain amino acid transport system / permease component n=1 Tax=Anaerobutyricum hallii TaxID=39488 RepID=A0A285PZP0_9FIRM|nr:galactoside ABC transporter permease [Anaerobutyricum hallii]SOB73425.1 Branched-chain amino acid transport system / permease component [Anaerobutyricum hallii]
MANGEILTAEQERQLRQPIDEYVGKIQKEIDELREHGTAEVIEYQNLIESVKRDKTLSKGEKEYEIKEFEAKLNQAKAVEAQNKDKVAKLIADAEGYLKENFEKLYYNAVKESCEAEKAKALEDHKQRLAQLEKEHKEALAGMSDQVEIKEENYVHKNRISNEKLELEKEKQRIKDRKHDALTYKYHLIDLLRLSDFTFAEEMAQKWENYKYTFNRRTFLLQNGLYIAIILIFIALCVITPIKKGTPLLTYNNVLNILQQASPRMFLALGVAGLILLTGTDLSVGRMVGMGMTAATIIMHQGVNTGSVFGHIFDFTNIPVVGRVILALVVCIVLCTVFTSIAGFFTAKFKMHPFISTMANMLVIFGLVTYATKGVSFGSIEATIPNMIIPKVNGFPTIILWALAAIVIVWFIWNKTTFGKNLYAVGGNPEAAAVSGISVFAVTLGAFVMAGILYGFGSWLECARMVGSGSAAYGQGWDMDAIAACVVGGVSFTGGIGKISGVVTGVCIFTALTYSLTILGIDTNLQFVFSGIIILIAVTLDCLKYVQKK